MALTNSTMLPLGTPAPDFRLTDAVSGKTVARDDFQSSPALLVAFICNHCPYVRHVRDAFAALAKEYQGKGLAVVGISSNDVKSHPDDAPPKMAAEAKGAGYVFPYVFDETQAVAKSYKAACTPDFYVFDRARKLVYRGRFDDSLPGNGKPVTGRDLRAACDAALAGKAVPEPHRPSQGCNIKWKAGNAPEYFG